MFFWVQNPFIHHQSSSVANDIRATIGFVVPLLLSMRQVKLKEGKTQTTAALLCRIELLYAAPST
jgi:hypothetical protein